MQTAAGSKAKPYDLRRKAIRETWLPQVKEYTDMAVNFVSGRSQDATMQASIEREHAAHGDFIFLQMQVQPGLAHCCGTHAPAPCLHCRCMPDAQYSGVHWRCPSCHWHLLPTWWASKACGTTLHRPHSL